MINFHILRKNEQAVTTKEDSNSNFDYLDEKAQAGILLNAIGTYLK
jgi:hypothetical protein